MPVGSNKNELLSKRKCRPSDFFNFAWLFHSWLDAQIKCGRKPSGGTDGVAPLPDDRQNEWIYRAKLRRLNVHENGKIVQWCGMQISGQGVENAVLNQRFRQNRMPASILRMEVLQQQTDAL
ncbi:unnamed protein product [Clavelina lepadiformis]|uniref:Transposase n=1 Tax=Clavelina lepadiformis TaxID=159417 RepID=A0ABP0G528_CLALP